MSADWSKLEIIHYPDPRLRQRCEPVTEFDADLAALAKRMLELMRAHNGVGLAAAQVGVPLRLFVMNTTEDAANDKVFANPELLDLTGAKESEEGCLSLPEVRVQVRRAQRGKLRAQDLKGQTVEIEADDLTARVWQHEIDHLNGVLIIDRMGPSDKIATKKLLRELELEFEELKKRGKKK